MFLLAPLAVLCLPPTLNKQRAASDHGTQFSNQHLKLAFDFALIKSDRDAYQDDAPEPEV